MNDNKKALVLITYTDKQGEKRQELTYTLAEQHRMEALDEWVSVSKQLAQCLPGTTLNVYYVSMQVSFPVDETRRRGLHLADDADTRRKQYEALREEFGDAVALETDVDHDGDHSPESAPEPPSLPENTSKWLPNMTYTADHIPSGDKNLHVVGVSVKEDIAACVSMLAGEKLYTKRTLSKMANFRADSLRNDQTALDMSSIWPNIDWN